METRRRLSRAAALAELTVALFLASSFAFASGDVPATNTYVYVAEQGLSYSIGSVAQFQMGSDGTLTPLSPGTVTANTDANPGSVIVDPSGRALLTIDVANETEIYEFPIGNDGTLGKSVFVVTSPNGFTSIAFTPDRRFAIVPNAATVSSYRVSGTGKWTLVGEVASGRSPLSAVVDPSGKFVYVANEGLNLISGYTISATGVLAPLEPKNVFPAGYLPYSLTISPNGFLYSPDLGSNKIAEFTIDASTGALTRAGSFSTGSGSQSFPRWIAFDLTGKYAYVANTQESTVSQFKVNPNTGALTRNGSDISAGLLPLQVVVDPSGKFVFTANGDGTVSEFSISKSGTLIANGTVSIGPISSYAIAFAQR